MKTVVTALFVACMPLVAVANEPLEVEEYHYGMNLDVGQVISVKPVQTDSQVSSCGLVEKEMIYKDSKGQEHDLKYEVMATGCTNG
ncbi:uncharacterized protein DUF2790 [Azomonas agilis]|uniref:Uncharacterized protein DUF2790 n=1 Tax=Azomonas agilis TaxID=116849 RepID=A0A562IZ20_9GAMM|nr:DUF2790 domain-containing protein [Azomonas agilis]TWH76301.1 uncharacterized protein DUF2790 [Azomonas agilis]